jgi:hypothetical protein
MSGFRPERRRAPRAAVTSPSWLSLPSTWSVRLMDVGLGGLAFSSPFVLAPGRSAALRATLGHEPFNSQIRVCWSRPSGLSYVGGSPYEMGAAFLPLDEGSRRALESFLKLSR